MRQLLYLKLKKWFTLILFGVVLSGVLLVVRFPGQQIKHFVVQTLERHFPGTECVLEDIAYRFPLTITVGHIRFQQVGRGETVFELENGVVKPAFFLPGRAFFFTAGLYGGKLGCRIRLDWEEERIYFDDLLIQRLNMARLEGLQNRLQRRFTGFFDFTGSCSAQISTRGFEEISGKITLNDGSLGLQQPLFLYTQLDLQRAQATIRLKKNRMLFSEGQFTGNQFKGKLGGTLQVVSPWTGSTFEMTGLLQPKATVLQRDGRTRTMVRRLKKQFGDGALPFVVQGTLGQPDLRFGR